MHTLSQPPTDLRDTPDDPSLQLAAAPATPVTRALEKTFDDGLRRTFRAFMQNNGLGQSFVARQLDVHPSALNKYLMGKPEGNVEKLEEVIHFYMVTEPDRQNLKRQTVETGLSRRIAKILRSIALTSDLAIINGPAGIGKTESLKLFLLSWPTTLLITAGEQHGNCHALINDIWASTVSRRRASEKQLTASEVLEGRFKNSNRLIIIDDAHCLTSSGFRWVKRFHDITEVAFALVGNPIMLGKITRLADEDQYTSRIGQLRTVGLIKTGKTNEPGEMAELLLSQYAPQLKDELAAAASGVCSQRGYARRLKKQLRLTLEILAGGVGDGPLARKLREKGMTEAQVAFAFAETQLLTVKEEA